MIIYRIEPNGGFFYEETSIAPADYIAKLTDNSYVEIVEKNQATAA